MNSLVLFYLLTNLHDDLNLAFLLSVFFYLSFFSLLHIRGGGNLKKL